MNRGFLICSMGLVALCGVALAADPLVAVTGGQIQGRIIDGQGVFKGVPYAAPPVGDRRWKEPAPVEAWKGNRDSAIYGASCAQKPAGWNDAAARTGKEDCLNLNIWTPEWPGKSPKAVIVWFHGGGNQGGSFLGEGGIEPSFDGARLAKHGVVVVSIGYRLGVLGFIAHPELTEESPHHASGNYGLMDQIASLRWVKENIAKFGGDPNNVTIMGQSAGAHDVGLVLTSPLAKGLFHKAIAESGSVIINGDLTRTRASMEKAGQILAANLKAPEKGAIKYLRTLSPEELFNGALDYNSRGEARAEPDIDGYSITKLPAAMYRDGESAPVPFLIGTNGRERTIAGGAAGLKKALEDYYGPLAAKALKIYEGAGDGYAPHGDANSLFATDMQFRCGSTTIEQWHSAKNPVYAYEFTRAPLERGAVHSWELQFVFGNLRQATAEADRKLSDQVQEYWTNFAKTGNPNGGSLPAWPKYDAKQQSYMDLSNDGPVAKEALRKEACDLYRERLAQEMERAKK